MAEKLANLPWSRALLIAVGLGAAAWFFASPDPEAVESNRNAAKAELQKQNALLADATKLAENAVRFEEENKRMEAQFKELVEFLPSEFNPGELVRTISTEAQRAGSEVVTIGALSKQTKKIEFYETATIDFTLRGTYAQLVLFLSYLTRAPRLVTFDRLEMASDPGASAGRITLKASAIAYRYVGTDDSAKDANAKAAAKPN